MNGLVVGLVLMAVPGWCREAALDKTGTSGCESAVPALETLKKQEPAGAGSFQAEREGHSGGSSASVCAKRLFFHNSLWRRY